MTCPLCDRTGILIYPVRYAVASPSGAKYVHSLSGNFTIENAPASIAPAKYALRALRPGYIYSYDEKRRRLKAYQVFLTGQLWHFEVDKGPPPGNQFAKGCIGEEFEREAHCLDLSHSERDPATRLWISWSSVLWTEAVRKKVDDIEWRRKHMTMVDVPAMLKGAARHTGTFSNMAKTISHLQVPQENLDAAFGFSNTPPKGERRTEAWVSELAKKMNRNGGGFVVAINDPVGITNDLSELVMPTPASGFDSDLYRGHAVEKLLTKLRLRVEEDARLEVRAHLAAEERAGKPGTIQRAAAEFTIWDVIRGKGIEGYLKKRNQAQDKYELGQKGREDAEAERRWRELITEGGNELLDHDRLASMQERYARAEEIFQPIKDQLAKAHVAWLSSVQLADWMAAVHDSNSLSSGYAYCESFAQCVGKAASEKHCVEKLQTWLGEPVAFDLRNIYCRALLFNQDEIAAAVNLSLKTGDVQFENIINAYRAALKPSTLREAAALTSRLSLTTANVLIDMASSLRSAAARTLVLAHFTICCGVPVRLHKVPIVDYLRWLNGQFGHLSGRSKNHPGAYEANKLPSGVIKVSSHGKVPTIEVPLPDTSGMERFGYRVADGSKMALPGLQETERWLSSSLPEEVRMGRVTAVLQLAALYFALKDLGDNDRFNAVETRTKASLQSMSLAATIAETVGNAAHIDPAHPLAVYLKTQWALDVEGGKTLTRIAKRAGLIAGMVAGVYDILLGYQALSEKRKWKAFGYFVSGGVGFAAAVCTFYSLSFWPLFVLVVVANIVIGLINSQALHEWVSKCYFSVNGAHTYRSLSEEVEQYYKAVEG